MSPFLSVCAIISGTLLGLASLIAVYRLQKGPLLLDRVIALDVLVTVFVGALCVYMVSTGTTDHITLLLVLAVVAWVGTLSFAIFLADRKGVNK
jgi:multicomponent Na+:H+ antiporter subunit F